MLTHGPFIYTFNFKSSVLNRSTTFSNLTWLNAILGLALICWQEWNGSIPFEMQLVYFVAMIALTGIPHGALDHIVAKVNDTKNGKQFQFTHFLFKYLVAIVFYAACWVFLPALSLLLFLVISAWHFGETDIPNMKKEWIWNINRILWGSFVLLLILLTHQKETETILFRITQNSTVVVDIWNYLCGQKLFVLSGFGTVVLTLNSFRYFRNEKQFSPLMLLNLIIILIISIYLPLLPSFALYFGGWHAIRSFEMIFTYLKSQQYNQQMNSIGMWRRTMPMTIMAGLFFVVASYVWSYAGISSDPLPVIFIFLSVITLPHLDVMNQMIKNSD